MQPGAMRLWWTTASLARSRTHTLCLGSGFALVAVVCNHTLCLESQRLACSAKWEEKTERLDWAHRILCVCVWGREPTVVKSCWARTALIFLSDFDDIISFPHWTWFVLWTLVFLCCFWKRTLSYKKKKAHYGQHYKEKQSCFLHITQNVVSIRWHNSDFMLKYRGLRFSHFGAGDLLECKKKNHSPGLFQLVKSNCLNILQLEDVNPVIMVAAACNHSMCVYILMQRRFLYPYK